jgi:hypothetical protein
VSDDRVVVAAWRSRGKVMEEQDWACRGKVKEEQRLSWRRGCQGCSSCGPTHAGNVPEPVQGSLPSNGGVVAE